MSKFIPFCPCCQSYNTDDKHQNHCLLGHAEQHIAELKQIIVDQEIHTGDLEQHITEMEQRLAAAEAMNKKLAKFFVGAIQCSFDGCDYDGWQIQDDALAMGLIEECDPPEGEESPWYRIVDDVKKLIEGE